MEQRNYDRKYFNLKALDVDTEARRVKVAIAELESIDRDNDVFSPSAFDVTIKQRGPQGTNEIWHLLDHTQNSFSALSKFTELNREGKYVAGVSQYKNSFAWREVAWPLYEAGDITQHSVGFKTEKQQKSADGSHNIITEASLWEGSAVLWGANPNTPTMGIVKSLLKMEDDREITAQEKLSEIITRIKKGKYTDEKAELLLIEMYRLQNMLDSEPLHKIITQEMQEKSSTPEQSSVNPDAVKKVDYAAPFHQLFKQKTSLLRMEQEIFNKAMDSIKADAVKEATAAAAEQISKFADELAQKGATIEQIQGELTEFKKKQGQLQLGEQKQKSFGEQLMDNFKANKDNIASLKNNRGASVSFDIKAAGTMTSSNYSGGNVGLTTFDSEFTRVIRRSPFLRQIVTVRPISTQGISWAEQANPDGGAGMTAEGAAKTQADFDWVERRETSKKITAYSKVSKEALDDLPSVASEINQELVELIELKLDDQILTGDNTGQNLKGLSQYASSFSVAGSPLALGVDFANNFDVIRAAAWQIANTGKGKFMPNYVLVNPVDAAVMDMTKTTQGSYVIPPFVSAGGQTIYGIKVIENTGVTAGDFYVLDSRKSVLGIREEININVGYENDDFTKNLVTILAEMRAFHYVKTNHAGSIVKGTFSTAKAALETA